ncbi:MAG: hypothetical protein C0404_10780 [Verrucomicrobia bacterium]|nr:hypothetical protein [Verrucomicrobiota bacterium]
MLTKLERAFLAELSRQKVEYVVVGLSAAALQGAVVVTQDVDLWFRDLGDPRIKKVLRKFKAAYVPPFGNNPPMFAGDAVDLFDIVVHMHGLGDFDDERKNVIKVKLGTVNVPVLSLERIIASKKALGRHKDKLVLRELTNTIKTLKTRRPTAARG